MLSRAHEESRREPGGRTVGEQDGLGHPVQVVPSGEGRQPRGQDDQPYCFSRSV